MGGGEGDSVLYRPTVRLLCCVLHALGNFSISEVERNLADPWRSDLRVCYFSDRFTVLVALLFRSMCCPDRLFFIIVFFVPIFFTASGRSTPPAKMLIVDPVPHLCPLFCTSCSVGLPHAGRARIVDDNVCCITPHTSGYSTVRDDAIATVLGRGRGAELCFGYDVYFR